MKREQEEKKGEGNKTSSLSSSKLLCQIKPLGNKETIVAYGLAQLYPIPAGTEVRHIGEKPNHSGCPL